MSSITAPQDLRPLWAIWEKWSDCSENSVAHRNPNFMESGIRSRNRTRKCMQKNATRITTLCSTEPAGEKTEVQHCPYLEHTTCPAGVYQFNLVLITVNNKFEII